MIRTAIILAAGKGKKIFPYTETLPKAALPIANRPLIQWQVERLRAAGMERILVMTGPLGGQVREAVYGMEGVECQEASPGSGTAEALLTALKRVPEEEFLVVYGDILFSQKDLNRFLNVADQGPAALVERLDKLAPQEWLCVTLERQRITSFLGHPREATHRLCGMYLLDHSVIPALENNPGFMTAVEVGNMPAPEAELAESLSQYIRRGGSLQAVETESFFMDIDKPWHWLDANSGWLEELGKRLREDQIHPDATIEEGAEIDGYVIIGKGSRIGHDVKIKGNVWIGENTRVIDGAIIGANVSIGSNTIVREYCKIEPNSSIGNRCVVGHAAEFGGILMDGAYSYHYGEYWGIIGRSSDLGAATVCGNLRFDDRMTQHVIQGRKENPATHSANAAYLGDYTRTGVNAILMPGVKVGPYSVIGAGVILAEDVPSRSLIYVKQELVQRSWGPEMYGW